MNSMSRTVLAFLVLAVAAVPAVLIGKALDSGASAGSVS